MSTIQDVFSATLLGATLRLSTPILLAALGGLFTERAGVVNIALEGMMLIAAFTGAAVAYWSHNAWVGLLGGILASMLVAALFALFAIRFKADIIVAGIAINLLAAGAQLVLMQHFFHTKGNFAPGVGLPAVRLDFLRNVPALGDIIGSQNILVYIGIVMIFIAHVALYRTRFGLRVRAVGENPEAAETVGIHVGRIQFATVLISGFMCGLGGVNLSLGYLSQFTSNMTSGRGFIALAAQTFGGASPVGTALASVFFGFSDALSVKLETAGLPNQFVLMIPYVATVAALVLVARRRALVGRRQPTVDVADAEGIV